MGQGFNLPDLSNIDNQDNKKDTKPTLPSLDSAKAAVKQPNEQTNVQLPPTATPQNMNAQPMQPPQGDYQNTYNPNPQNILNQDLGAQVNNMPPNMNNNQPQMPPMQNQMPPNMPVQNNAYYDDTQDFQQVDEDSTALPDNLSINNEDDFVELDDNDFNDTSYAEMAFGNQEKTHTIKGVIEDFQESEGELMFVVHKNDKATGVFYLRKKITNGNMDSILRQAGKGVPIEVQYKESETELTDDGTPVYMIDDLINIDLNENMNAPQPTPTYDDKDTEDDYDEPQPKPKKKKKHKTKPSFSFKRIIDLNNFVGQKIFNILGIPFGLLTKIPLIGKLLKSAKPFWRFLCNLWILLVLLLGFFVFHHPEANQAEYALKNNITVEKPAYHNNQVTLHVINESNTYQYYYLNATLTKKGIIPFTKKEIKCSGPSIGQNINNKQKMVLKCKGEPLTKVNSYTFDIHLNNK